MLTRQLPTMFFGLVLALGFGLTGLRGQSPPGPSTATLSFSDLPQELPRPALNLPQPALGEADRAASPLAQAAQVTVLPPADENLVDLATALQLAQAQNPSIAISIQAIQEALAGQLQARAMFLPTMRLGVNYHYHEGQLQTGSGLMRPVTENSLYFGNGAFAFDATTATIPGVQIFSHLGDGFLAPLIARQEVASRQFEARAATNQILLDVAGRYLDLVRAEAELGAIRLSEKDVARAVVNTQAYADAKQGREADALRARTVAELLHADEAQAQENVLTASAELVRVLSLSPSVRLRIPAPPAALLELVDAQRALEELLRLAEGARPELSALSAEIERKRLQVRQEKIRPFLPTISVAISEGSYGGGITPYLGQFSNRTDFDVITYWTLENMGVGNWAKTRQRRSEQNLASLEYQRVLNVIRREVTTAQAAVLARGQDLIIAQRRLKTAEQAFRLDFERIKSMIGLPIELLNSVNRLTRARRDVVRVVQEYNLAQMRLFVALGQTPQASLRPQEPTQR